MTEKDTTMMHCISCGTYQELETGTLYCPAEIHEESDNRVSLEIAIACDACGRYGCGCAECGYCSSGQALCTRCTAIAEEDGK